MSGRGGLVAVLMVGGLVVGLVGACGAEPSATPAPGPRSLLEGAPLTGLSGTAMVLEDASHGPQFCFGAIATSDPPQCGGMAAEGWDWSALPVEGFTEKGGTRYGSFRVSGTLAGVEGPLRLDAPPTPLGPGDSTGHDLYPGDDDAIFATRCPEPAGGWRPVDPSRATEEAAEEASRIIAADPAIGVSWIDQRLPDEIVNGPMDELERRSNDPLNYVLNVTTTGDTAELESRIRAVWGGALCVGPASVTEARLLEIADELRAEPGVLDSQTWSLGGYVTALVSSAPADLQQRLDDRFGPGLVRWEAAFVPAVR